MIEENISSIVKSIERLGLHLKKQRLLNYIEGMVKEKSTMIEGKEGSSIKGKSIKSMIDGSNSIVKEVKNGGGRRRFKEQSK